MKPVTTQTSVPDRSSEIARFFDKKWLNDGNCKVCGNEQFAMVNEPPVNPEGVSPSLSHRSSHQPVNSYVPLVLMMCTNCFNILSFSMIQICEAIDAEKESLGAVK